MKRRDLMSVRLLKLLSVAAGRQATCGRLFRLCANSGGRRVTSHKPARQHHHQRLDTAAQGS